MQNAKKIAKKMSPFGDRLGHYRIILRCRLIFQLFLSHIHTVVGTLEDPLVAVVLAGDILGAAHRYHYLGMCAVLFGYIVELCEEPFSVIVVVALQDDDELVAADPVYRVAVETPADLTASLFDIFVAGIVTEGIVDRLEVVEIKDGDS